MTDLAAITAVYQWPQPGEGVSERKARSGLDNEGPGAAQILSLSGEVPVVVGHGRDGLVVVTSERTIVVKRGKVRRDIPHTGVRETRLMQHPGLGPFVVIYGQGAHNVMLNTMSAANNVAVTIDRFIGG